MKTSVVNIPTQLETLSPPQLKSLVRRAASVLEKTSDAAEVVKISAMLDAAQHLMYAAGMYKFEEIREVVEARIRARWRLGQLLEKMDRQKVAGPGRGKKGGKTKSQDVIPFKENLEKLSLGKMDALRAQRLGKLPEEELEKSFQQARKQDVLCTLDGLIKEARPYWYKASREQKHRAIAAAAKNAKLQETIGPFSLIYLDPPWEFKVYSPKGLERTPDQHCPTLTDAEIINFKVDGKTVPQLAHKDAVLLMWCTSSNIKRALAVVEDAWGFECTASAVWDKGKTGTGLVFRNQHEVLLYCKRGKMPGPQYQPKSVFKYPRGRHSAKPPEIRKEIEKMYPDFDATTRLELFCRGEFKGWTCRGFEAKRSS